MSRFIVTGYKGFIGHHLTNYLLDQGHEVIGIDNGHTEYNDFIENNLINKSEKFTALNQDMNYVIDHCEGWPISSFFFPKDIGTINCVFHLGAKPRVQYSIKNPIETNEANVSGTLKILELMKLLKIPYIVFSSSYSVYGEQEVNEESLKPEPMSPYALQKLIGEMYINMYSDLYGIRGVCLRYHNVIGKEMDEKNSYANLIPKFSRKAKLGEDLPIFGDGEQVRDMTDVRDVVQANIKAFEYLIRYPGANFDVFNIGSGISHSVNDITKTIMDLTNSKSKVVHLPPVIEPRKTLANISKAEKWLRWKPMYSFENSMKWILEKK